MQDLKNLFIACISTTSSIFAAIESKEVVSIVSAIVLPMMLFLIGKAVDVAVQFYLRKRFGERDK